MKKGITFAQAARELGISTTAIRFMVQTGKLSATMASGDGKRDHYIIDADSFNNMREYRKEREKLDRKYFGTKGGE